MIPLLLQAPLPLLWSLPHFVATLRVCSSFYVIAPRLDIKHPRHPVFTANSVQHLPTGVFEVVKLEPIVVDCGVNRKKKKKLQPADVPVDIVHHTVYLFFPDFWRDAF